MDLLMVVKVVECNLPANIWSFDWWRMINRLANWLSCNLFRGFRDIQLRISCSAGILLCCCANLRINNRSAILLCILLLFSHI